MECDAMSDYDFAEHFSSDIGFSVKWKNAGAAIVAENYVHGNLKSVIGDLPRRSCLERRNWDRFKTILTNDGECDVRVTYFDDDGDEIPIESQCEFDAFFRYAVTVDEEERTLIVEKLGVPVATSVTKNTEDSENVPQAKATMAPMQLDRCVQEFGQKASQSQRKSNETQAENSGDAAPKWFTNYMQTMKAEIVSEVSERVTKSVLEALSKRQESQYDSATSYLRASDSECLLDSELDERVSLAENVASICGENRDKRDSWFRPGAQRHETSRRRHRHADGKQRKKHAKSHVFHPDETTWRSPSYNRRRGEKTARNKRDADEAPHNSSRPELFVPAAKLHKLRLASPQPEEAAPKSPAEKPQRMSCSVTGRDLLERTNDRLPEYCALSDSDNISIISDVSHTSEMLRINNDFEMILNRSSTAFNDENEENREVAEGYVQIPRESEDFTAPSCEEAGREDRVRISGFRQIPQDPDDTRDSSSFELLSEPPPSPPLSIHMNEDHFAPGGGDEPNDYNMNDETTSEKRGNRCKIDKRAYAIDAHGRIYQRNITDDGEDGEEIVLEKRSGGAYSFVGEALPAPIKESVVLVAGADSPAARSFAAADDVAAAQEIAEEARENGGSAFHESTQSFHSHTEQRAENERQGCSAGSGRRGEAAAASSSSASHVFVDRNASKGLGDTKQSSPRRRAAEKEKKSPEDSEPSARSSRRTSQDSSGSAGRNANSRQERDSRRFGDWYAARNSRMMNDLVFNAVDPMHILPETLVTGAVHVASSAYITARRVYDKILTAQTQRKHADRSKFGRR